MVAGVADPVSDCVICRGSAGDAELMRVQVWEDARWRLTTSVMDQVPGFSYLEPKRHIPHITDLDGEEARTLGQVLARVTSALREETRAELVYVLVFGGSVPHLHLHLAPHREGDALSDQLLRGELEVRELESGAQQVISKDFPLIPETELRAVADRLRRRLSEQRGMAGDA
jgi:diadenosine tetraphosphate (Ap4A) HIT family hydrolase